MSPVDMVELTRLSHPEISPDGNHIVYRRSQVNWKENVEVNRYRLITLPRATSSIVLDAGDADEDFKRVVWRPNSEGFAAFLKRGADQHQQAYYFQLSDSMLTRLTEHPEDVTNVTWSPDGQHIFFTADVPLDPAEEKLLEKEWVLREYETVQPKELWTRDVESGDSRRIVGGDFSVRQYSLSRDGKKLVYTRDPYGLEDAPGSEIYVLDIDSGESARVTENNYAEFKANISPDNETIAFVATVNPAGEQYYEDNVFVVRIGQKSPVPILAEYSMKMLSVEWDASGEGLFILGNTGVRTNLYHYNLASSVLNQVTTGDQVVSNWTYDAGLDVHTFLCRTQDNPGEIHTLKTGDTTAKQVSDEYEEFAKRFEVPTQTVFTWRGEDGQVLEGLLVYPLDHTPGKAFPLVTITHGGPRQSAQFGSWNVSRYVPVLAGQGYGVFLPNHRGSAGYGDDFLRDMVGGYFTNAHHDVLTGVDALVEKGLADPDRLIKMGWSAGGHMTNKMITVTDRFQAASSGAGVADWASFYGESDIRHNRTPWFGTAPWAAGANLESFAEQSILKDLWKVKTPTLFFVGEKDERVPPTQSILMYRGVKATGTPTELYVAPDQPHNYRAPSYRLFKINTELAWYAKHLGLPPYEAVLPAAAKKKQR